MPLIFIAVPNLLAQWLIVEILIKLKPLFKIAVVVIAVVCTTAAGPVIPLLPTCAATVIPLLPVTAAVIPARSTWISVPGPKIFAVSASAAAAVFLVGAVIGTVLYKRAVVKF